MRAWGAAFPLCCWLMALPAWAQEAAPASVAGDKPCVDVRIGGEPTYGCLNAELARIIPPRSFSAGAELPVPANIPAPAAGTFNQAATAEQMGTAFGHSTRPQRPPPPVYSSPLIQAR